jgi:hypothetical protein
MHDFDILKEVERVQIIRGAKGNILTLRYTRTFFHSVNDVSFFASIEIF